eukprot:TRINITY_DN982_c0_g1_i1.p1 TRINITY_DN982_c0_g1~~TRINITY_DN982_c0_g1_i1.p1  ORF type:complete len:202 (+),score=43.18 TRINITY_DN982_c0_g1_i1:230-835(+)
MPRLEFAEDDYPDDISWEIIDQNKKLVAKGGFLGNRCIYLEDACYTLIVKDEFGDGNSGFTASLEKPDGTFDTVVDQAAYDKKELDVSICTVNKSCAILAISPDDYKEDTTWKVTDKLTGKEVDKGDYTGSPCLKNMRPGQKYVLHMFDQYNDGMCCKYGDGSFVLYFESADGVRTDLVTYRPTEDDEWDEWTKEFTIPAN